MQPEEKITKISINLLVPNAHQPRKVFNDASLKELALSIKEYGILNPILVRKKDNLYEIIAGERRYRAAKLVDIKEVPVIIKDVDESKLAEIALIENLQRENISPIEEAKSYQDILNLSNLKEQELSDLIGKSQSYISNKLRLLKLPLNIQDALINKKISERHARSLITVKDTQTQTELLHRVINEKLTVKELETIINEKQITGEEIKSAINDIMKSLQLDNELINEKKEEKESDKMNNENFFPNTNNNLNDNQNINLNAMNMQTLNNTSGEQPQVINQPSMVPSFEVPEQNIAYNQAPQVPSEAAPTIPQSPIPNFAPSPIPEVATNPSLEVPFSMPSFDSSTPNTTMEGFINPQVPNNNPMTQDMPTTSQILDQPLFDPNNQIIAPQEANIPIDSSTLTPPTYEIPVDANIITETNKLTEVQTLLNNNGINYKTYSNETGHCIIIEL